MMRFGTSLGLCTTRLPQSRCPATLPCAFFTTSSPKTLGRTAPKPSVDVKKRRPNASPPLRTKEATTSGGERMRLNKWMAHQGLCSRREADDWISRGLVSVNGQVVTTSPAFCIPGVDDVQVHKDKHKGTSAHGENATILFHKPLGVVSSQPEDGHSPAIQLLTSDRQFRGSPNGDPHSNYANPFRQRGWAVAGRLDINSTGLLVLTRSGVVAQQIVSPRPGVAPVEKEYLVRIPSTTTDLDKRLKTLREGVNDIGDFLQAERIEVINSDQLRFVLTQGKHHHIRRMLKAVQVPVRALKRVRIGNVVLADLPLGQWRYLGPHETFR